MLEVEDEGSGEQDADQPGQEVQPRDDRARMLEAMPERLDRRTAARASVRQAHPHARVVDRCHVQPERHQDGCREDQRGGDERGLETLQAPAEPDHDGTSSCSAGGRPRYASTISSSATSSTCQRES